MKVLMIGTDRRMFEDGSGVLARTLEYASKMDELHIVVFALKNNNLTFKKINNLYLYPTNSRTKLGFLFNSYFLGKGIVSKQKMIKGTSVISCQDPFETGLVGWLLHKSSGLPFQLQVHTDFSSSYFRITTLNKIRVFIAGFLIPRAQGIRVVGFMLSGFLKNKFSNIKAKIDVLPIFVDIDRIINSEQKQNIKLDFPQYDNIVFIASRLAKEKRIDVSLHVIKKVIQKFPHTGLVISGDGPEKNKLRDLTKKLDLEKNVVFLGWQVDLSSYYKSADVFLLTSEYEGYGMTLIEAGASGCPIVTTKVGIASTDTFQNGYNSFVCSVDDVECLSESVINLIEDTEKRKLFKDRMRDSIKTKAISKEEYIDSYVALLQKLL
jgi:glycosyltransferase involved in cell wall biosynthesis